VTSETYPSGRVVSYAFDDGARLSQVSSGSTVYANQFDYSSSQGLLKSVTLGNGAVESYGYNSRLQMKSIDLAKSGTQIQHYDYKYGVYDPATNTLDETKNNGQIAQIEGLIGTQKQWQQRFAYDLLGRLSSAREFRGDNGAQSYLINYNYDLFGNRYQYQSQNSNNPFSQVWVESGQINQANNRFNSGVTYDDAGNITVDSKFRNLQFQYDANNRQKQSANLDGTGVVVSVYDAGGQRVATQVDGSLTNVCVYDGMGKLVAEYGPASSGTGGTSYFMSDHQGSPRVVTSNTGIVISRHDYLPFGEELSAGVGLRNSNQGYGGADAARQKYAGMESDDGSGMATTLWRKYDSSSGRWASPDPYGGSMTIASPQTFNRYSYVGNDPVNMRDPSGLMTQAGQPDPDNAPDPADEPPGDPFETGRDIIGAAEARHDRWVDIDRNGGKYGDKDYPKTSKGDTAGGGDAGKAGGDSPTAPIAFVDVVGSDVGVSQTGSGSTTNPANSNSTMVILWEPYSVNRWGHVSYITMQDDHSYSWEGVWNWTEDKPSAKYTDKRSKDSAGRGYVFDFRDRKINEKFQKALIHAYDYAYAGYNPIWVNCGMAFNAAINAIRKDIGVPSTGGLKAPESIKNYIQTNLMPFVVEQRVFPKH
jgi:RHS repeat-associated protein